MDKCCHCSATKPMTDVSSCHGDALRRKELTTLAMWLEWFQSNEHFKLCLEEQNKTLPDGHRGMEWGGFLRRTEKVRALLPVWRTESQEWICG